MAGQQFEYDERGSTFYYFMVSFYALVLVPATYYFWPRDKKKDIANDKRCRCRACERKEELKKSKEPKKRIQYLIIKFVLLLGWIGFALLAYKAATAEFEHHEYDPYAILGLDRGASVEEVKKAYRKLSMKHHPDRGGDSKIFVAITKAHQALTDDEARKNWEEYGNPDGPGALRFGIALPSWLVSKEYGFLVLLAYGVVFMLILPIAVGIWWYRSIKYSADQVLIDTTKLYCSLLHRASFQNTKKLLAIISSSFEFAKQCNKEIVERPTDNEEVPRLMKQLPTFDHTPREKPACFGWPHSVKTRALLHAHLSRVQLPLNTLELDRQYIVRKSPLLIQELIQSHNQLTYWYQANRAQRMPSLETLDNIFKLSPMIVQACWENKSALLQLPHFTEETLRHCVKRKRHVKTCADLADLTEEDRASMLRSFNKREYQDVVNVLGMMPRVEMNVRVEVQDEDDKQTITEGAWATAVVSLKRTPLLDGAVSNGKLPSNSTSAANNLLKDDDDAAPVENGEANEESDAEQGENGDPDEAGNAAANNQKKKPVWQKQKQNKKGGKKKKHQPAVQAKTVGVATNKAVEASPKPAESEEKPSTPRKRKKAKEVDEDKANDGSASESGEDDEDLPLDEPPPLVDDDEEDDFLMDDDMGPKEKLLESKSKITHLVHCPYFLEEKYEWYWVYICDRKRRMLVCPPVSITTLINEEEVKLKFPAPKKGTYTYQVCLRCDSYLDVDINRDIKIQVHEAKVITKHPQWEFESENEDDGKSEKSAAASEYTEEEEENEEENSE